MLEFRKALGRTLFTAWAIACPLLGCGKAPIDPRPPAPAPTEADIFARQFERTWCSASVTSESAKRTVRHLLLSEAESNCAEAAKRIYVNSVLRLQSYYPPTEPLTNLEPLRGFKNLRVLYLAANRFSTVDQLEPLRDLPHLEELDLSRNQFQSFAGISKVAPRLKKLSISFNPVRLDTGRLWDGTDLNGLTELDLCGLRLTTVPASLPNTLEVLHLSGNPLEHSRSLADALSFPPLALKKIWIVGVVSTYTRTALDEELRELKRRYPVLEVHQ